MSRKQRKKQKNKGQYRSSAGLRAWWQNKHPILLFILVFSLLILLFYILINLSFFKTYMHPQLISLNAAISGFILNVLGQNVAINGSVISSAQFSIDIKLGCDALEPMALFNAVVLAYPASISKKGVGIVCATFLLFSANIVRIVSLYFAGIYNQWLFDVMHETIWQFLFILFAISLCAYWINWVNAKQSSDGH